MQSDPTQRVLDLASRLIERPSVTPDDAGCQDLLIDALEYQGFQVTPLPYGPVRNFWAIRGTAGPLVVLAGHTDVVPSGPPDQWRFDPFEPTVADGMLYGRGAADMKGALAAMIVATERFYQQQPEARCRIAYLVTSDEEGDAEDGTVRVVDWLENQSIRPDYCIVGEPSSRTVVGDCIRVGRRGSLNGTLRILGVQGHVAYPEQADNPIHRSLAALQCLVETTWDQGNERFPPTSFQISNIHAGTGTTNVIPGELMVQFNLRYSTEQTAVGLEATIREILDRHGLRYELSLSVSGEPFQTATSGFIEQVTGAIRDTARLDPERSTGGGTSDGRFIARLGTEIIELGLVNATIHSVDERVAVGDLGRLSDMYLGILNRLAG